MLFTLFAIIVNLICYLRKQESVFTIEQNPYSEALFGVYCRSQSMSNLVCVCVANITIQMLGLHALCTLLLVWNENVCLSSYMFVIKLLKLRKNLADSNLIYQNAYQLDSPLTILLNTKIITV